MNYQSQNIWVTGGTGLVSVNVVSCVLIDVLSAVLCFYFRLGVIPLVVHYEQKTGSKSSFFIMARFISWCVVRFFNPGNTRASIRAF